MRVLQESHWFCFTIRTGCPDQRFASYLWIVKCKLCVQGESPEDWQRRLLALLSFIAMSIAYPAMFLLSAELMPAVLRGSVLGVANLMARLGNTTAPIVGPTVTNSLSSSTLHRLIK